MIHLSVLIDLSDWLDCLTTFREMTLETKIRINNKLHTTKVICLIIMIQLLFVNPTNLSDLKSNFRGSVECLYDFINFLKAFDRKCSSNSRSGSTFHNKGQICNLL